MTDVRLSIVIPTKGRPTLNRTLGSILEAGYRSGDDIRVIAVDTKH
jgi:glycosyltransferase involved in cell wall biosynthesis